MPDARKPDLGVTVVALLAQTLMRLADQLRSEGFERASDLVVELARRCDAHLAEPES